MWVPATFRGRRSGSAGCTRCRRHRKSLRQRNNGKEWSGGGRARRALPCRGRRKTQGDGVAVRHKESKACGTRKTKSAFNRIVSGILKKEAQEARAGTQSRIGIAKPGAVETALAGIGRIVTRVAEPRHSNLGYKRGLFEERNFLRRNVAIQVRYQHLSEGISV